jgi:hypothetical protein
MIFNNNFSVVSRRPHFYSSFSSSPDVSRFYQSLNSQSFYYSLFKNIGGTVVFILFSNGIYNLKI